jgi:hypothetical protein
MLRYGIFTTRLPDLYDFLYGSGYDPGSSALYPYFTDPDPTNLLVIVTYTLFFTLHFHLVQSKLHRVACIYLFEQKQDFVISV